MLRVKDSQLDFRAGYPGWRRFSSLKGSPYSLSLRLASPAPMRSFYRREY